MERLNLELAKHSEKLGGSEIKATTEQNLAWLGAAENFDKVKWMTREEYEDHGPAYIHTKVVF